VQTARYVVKQAKALTSQRAPPVESLPSNLQYLTGTLRDVVVGKDGWLQAALAMRAKWLVYIAIRKLLAHPDSGSVCTCLLLLVSEALPQWEEFLKACIDRVWWEAFTIEAPEHDIFWL
jgi:hypothetical protein